MPGSPTIVKMRGKRRTSVIDLRPESQQVRRYPETVRTWPSGIDKSCRWQSHSGNEKVVRRTVARHPIAREISVGAVVRVGPCGFSKYMKVARRAANTSIFASAVCFHWSDVRYMVLRSRPGRASYLNTSLLPVDWNNAVAVQKLKEPDGVCRNTDVILRLAKAFTGHRGSEVRIKRRDSTVHVLRGRCPSALSRTSVSARASEKNVIDRFPCVLMQLGSGK